MNAKPKILIVEDESVIAFDLSRRLPKLGYEVCAIISTGEEAAQKTAELKPDLVLMDICLRGEMDGIAAAQVIRRQNDVPVIFLTANSDEMTLKRAKLSRPSSYLLKPFKERELQIGIDMALLNHRLQTELQAARDQLEHRVAERTAELAQVNETLRAEVEVRKRTEAQAREQADLLAKARDAIYVRDLAGSISFWNQSAERLYGVAAAEAIGRPAASLLGEEEGADTSREEAATREQGEWTGELRHRTRAGQELIVESRWTLVRDDQGTPVSILVVNTDITERKKIAEQFLRTQRLESIGALASGIAHDLNNVFSPILMGSDLLNHRNPEGDPIVAMVGAAARRGASMVRQVLMFVRGGDSVMQPVGLDHLAREVQRLMAETLPCSIQVTAEIPKGLPPVMGDSTQLHQVLMNLCVNARDAMPEGGELRLGLEEVEVDAARAADHGDLKPGPYLRLTVADTGTGMPPEVRQKIFEPFFTTKEVGKGTGLGLSTVAAIVRSHQGFLEVESQLGRGSSFLIHLPVCVASETETETARPDLPAGRGELILVVDDEHSIRQITKLTLEAGNYRVVMANDGAEALSLYLEHREEVALVMTDVMMPIMNGRALIHALRKLAPGLPVLACSAAERSNPLVGALDAERVTLLRKPATRSQMLAAIAAALHPEMLPPETPTPATARLPLAAV